MEKQDEQNFRSRISKFQFITVLSVIFFMLVIVFFATQKNNNYSYKSSAQEVPTPTVTLSPTITPQKGVPRYNCQALCNQVFKIPENKVKCINPCNKVGDRVSEGMSCRTACDKSILNGARKQFCYKFCPSITVGTVATPTPTP